MITSDQLFAFNHEQIENVCYMGYKKEELLDFARKKLNSYVLLDGHKDTSDDIYNEIN